MDQLDQLAMSAKNLQLQGPMSHVRVFQMSNFSPVASRTACSLSLFQGEIESAGYTNGLGRGVGAPMGGKRSRTRASMCFWRMAQQMAPVSTVNASSAAPGATPLFSSLASSLQATPLIDQPEQGVTGSGNSLLQREAMHKMEQRAWGLK